MSYSKARFYSTILISIAIFVSLFLFAFEEITALFIILATFSIALLVCAFVIIIKFYRCPHCCNLLPVRSAPRDYCPSCGKKL